MQKTLRLVKQVFFSPHRAYQDINEQTKLLHPFLIYSLTNICIGIFWYLFVYQSFQGAVIPAADSQSMDLIKAFTRKAVLHLLSIPVENFLYLVVTAVALWLILGNVAEVPIHFRKCFSLTVYSSIILLLLPITFFLLVFAKSHIHNLGDTFTIHLGLDIFFTSLNLPKWLDIILSQINIFSIIWLTFLFRGAGVIFKLDKKTKYLFIPCFMIFWLLLGLTYSKIKFVTL